MNLHQHQETALNKLKNGSILWGGVGTGKSRVAIAYYVENESPKDIYVITTAKKRDSADWVGEAAAFAIGTRADETVGGILTVDSWNKIAKYTDVENAFFIFDEQRLVGSGKWVKAFLKIAKKNNWIMLSATPGDTWMDYIPVFIANGWYKNRTDFINQHVIWAPYVKYPKVARYIQEGKLLRHRNDILVQMRYARETVRHIKTVTVGYDKELMDIAITKRWNMYNDRPIRDAGELYLVMRKIVNDDPSRLEMVKELMTTHKKLIIFYNFNYELEKLRTLNELTNVAEWNGHKHEDLPRFSEWIYLVQYSAGSEGWNCVDTDSMIFYSLTPSFKKFEQSLGRIDRMNTKFIDLFYYVFKSTAKIDKAIYRCIQAKKDFNFNNFNFDDD